MTGFAYTYTSIEDIFANITTLANFSIFEYILLFILLWGMFALVYIVLPTIFIMYNHHKSQKEKKKKKNFLTQISLQREIEDEIEKEIETKDKQIMLDKL